MTSWYRVNPIFFNCVQFKRAISCISYRKNKVPARRSYEVSCFTLWFFFSLLCDKFRYTHFSVASEDVGTGLTIVERGFLFFLKFVYSIYPKSITFFKCWFFGIITHCFLENSSGTAPFYV